MAVGAHHQQVGLALGAFGTAARAETNDDMSYSGMFKADRIDKNKDGNGEHQ